MNNLIGIVIFLINIILIHIISIYTQGLSSKDYFYGVYVKKIEIDNETKDYIHKKYKNELNLSFLAVVLFFVVTLNFLDLNYGLNIVISMILYIIFMFLALKRAYDEVKLIKNNYLSEHKTFLDEKKQPKKVIVDTILINEKSKLQKKFKILYSICIILSLLSLSYTIINYKNMPDTIITHWGINGEADGFSKKSIFSVFFINIIDLSMVIMFYLLGIGMLSSKTYLNINNLEENRKKAIKYLNRLGYTFLFILLSIQSMTTTMPIFMVKEMPIPIALVIFGIIAPLFASIMLIYYYIMLRSIKTPDKNIYKCEDDDEKWLYGIFYYNKEDPSFLVEKRLGMGSTINLAHPVGIALLILTFLILFISLIAVFIV